jgi:hypothetical protein
MVLLGLRVLQTVISTAAAFVIFEALDAQDVPLAVGVAVLSLVLFLVIQLVRSADNRERRRAGLPRAASATLGVAFAFSLLDLAGSAGAGAVVWASDSCTMQVGTHNANITLTGFFSKAVCQKVETSAQNRELGFLGDVVQGLSQFPVVGGVFGAVGSAQFHDSSPGGDVICTGWYRQARWVVITVRDQGVFDSYGNAMCGSLSKQGLLTYPWVS